MITIYSDNPKYPDQHFQNFLEIENTTLTGGTTDDKRLCISAYYKGTCGAVVYLNPETARTLAKEILEAFPEEQGSQFIEGKL